MITRSSSLLALLADAQAAGAVVLLSAPLLNSLSCSATDPFDGLVVVEAPCARGLKAPDRADAKTCGAVQPHPICRTLPSEGPANRCNAAAQCARGPEAPPFDDDLPAPWQSHVSKRTGKVRIRPGVQGAREIPVLRRAPAQCARAERVLSAGNVLRSNIGTTRTPRRRHGCIRLQERPW